MAAKTRAKRAAEFAERCHRDPAFFAKEMLGIELQSFQADALRHIAGDPMGRVVARCARGSGKTYGIAAVSVAWFMACFAPCRVITTAPTWYQVENLTWRDLQSIMAKSPRLKTSGLLKTRWELTHDRFASGISTDVPARIEGPHSDNVLVIIDEAKGVPQWAWTSLEGSFSTCKRANEIAVSTPWDKGSEFYEVCVGHRGGWKEIHVPAHESTVIKPAWIQMMIERYGEDHPIVQSQVYANFVDIASRALVQLDWIEKAYNREPTKETGAGILGIDISRGGPDATVFVVRRGNKVTAIEEARGEETRDTMRTANRAVSMMKSEDIETAIVDSTGIGGPVADRIREMGYDAIDFEAGAGAVDDERFLNVRAESYFHLRELFRAGTIDLTAIRDGIYRELVSQLTTLEYEYDEGGKLRIEKKDHWRSKTARQSPERTSHSPDHADALAIAFSTDVDGRAQFDATAYSDMEMVLR